MTQRTGAWRRARLGTARLYLCVDRRPHGGLEQLLDDCCAGGVDILQLRDKHATDAELRAAAQVFDRVAGRHDALFVVNDDPVLAAEVEADGVHVGQDDASPEEARRIVGAERLVGRSTHSVEQIDRALAEDCDTFTVGPVLATPTKQGRTGIGLEPVAHAARVAGSEIALQRPPWFVSGGMAPDTVSPVLGAGGRRLIVVRALTEADDPRVVVRRLQTLLDAPPAPPA